MPTPDTSSASTTPTVLPVGDMVTATQTNPAACSSSPVTITDRRPIRSDSAPATGEISIGVTSQGSRRSPVTSGE